VRAGTNTMLGLAPERIPDVLTGLAAKPSPPQEPPEGWDGQAAARVADVLTA